MKDYMKERTWDTTTTENTKKASFLWFLLFYVVLVPKLIQFNNFLLRCRRRRCSELPDDMMLDTHNLTIEH